MDKGTGTTNKLDTGTGGKELPSYTPTTSDGYTGGGGGGGGGGASAKAAAQKQQKETQAQLNNTADIFQRRKDDMDDNAKDYLANLDKAANDRLGDMDRNSQSALNNVIGKMGANDTQLSDTRFSNMQNIKWQPDQQKEQNTFMSLRNRMGNAAYGSGIQGLIEGMTTIDDMSDAAALDAWKQNENNAYQNWYGAYTGLIDDYNTNVIDILDAYSKFRNEYQEKFDEFNYKYRDAISSLQSQYATTQSNINALLASKQNLNAAADPKKAVQKAKDIKKVANTTIKKSGKTVKKINTKGLKGVEKKAAKLINDAIGSKSSKNSSAVKNAVNKAANKLIKNAKKPTVGSGTDKYTLPKANFDPVTFTSTVNANPDDILQSMLVSKSYEPTQSNFAKEWIRPNQENEIQSGLNSGETTTSRAANSGFLDNLSAFSRVPKPNNNITQPQTKTSNNRLTGVRNINYNPTQQALAKATTDSAKSVAAELALYKKNQAKNTKSIAAELALKKRNQARGFA